MSPSWKWILAASAISAAALGEGDAGSEPAPSTPPAALVARGEALYAQHICSVCHSNDGSARAAPTFKGLFGRDEKLRDGTKARVDAAYIRESILTPGQKVTDGYQPVMPAYLGRISDEEIAALTAYIESLR